MRAIVDRLVGTRSINSRVFRCVHQEANLARVIDEGKCECQPPRIKFRHKIRDHYAASFLQGQRCRETEMRYVHRRPSRAESDRVDKCVRRAARQKIELILVFLRRDLWIDFTAHAHNRFFGNWRRARKGFRVAIRKLLCASSGGTQRSSPK